VSGERRRGGWRELRGLYTDLAGKDRRQMKTDGRLTEDVVEQLSVDPVRISATGHRIDTCGECGLLWSNTVAVHARDSYCGRPNPLAIAWIKSALHGPEIREPCLQHPSGINMAAVTG
jgi:hypothetical protein